ncbi:hypothetical protein R3P38DRAFT_3535455, partial [Favolaschia claudopus]
MQATQTHLVNGHTASALHSSEIHSQISAHYARSLGIPISSRVPSLFVSLSAMASVAGSSTPFFTHHPFAIRIAENLPADIILGSDWSTVCRAAAWNTGVVFAAGTYEATFNMLPAQQNIAESMPAVPGAAEMSAPAPAALPIQPAALSATQAQLCVAQNEISTYRSLRGSVDTATVQRSTFNVHAKQRNVQADVERCVDGVVQGPELNIDGSRQPLSLPSLEMDPFVQLSLDDKHSVVHFLVVTSRSTALALRNMVARHENMFRLTTERKEKNATTLQIEFGNHRCTKACLILKSEAARAGITSTVAVSATELQESSLILKLRTSCGKRKAVATQGGPRKCQKMVDRKINAEVRSFPIILSQTEKDEIIREFRESTSNIALKRYECSFCGKLELASEVKMKAVADLDISLLEKAVQRLRVTSSQPRVESFNRSSLINNSTYVLCHLCDLSVTKNSFRSLPVRSYANGLWIGDVPPELQELTFLEEQCIARARATRCMYKIHLGPTGQLAARDEICVVLVGSPDTEVTQDTLRKSPLLVRRENIRKALFWLIENNPLYSDLNKQIVDQNLEEYPAFDCPLAVKEFVRTNSANNQGASYTTYSEQANSHLFEASETFELTSTTLVDVDNLQSTYKQRKL